MPGPMSSPAGSDIPDYAPPLRATHEKCQERERCTGPGCRIRTGKTRANRSK